MLKLRAIATAVAVFATGIATAAEPLTVAQIEKVTGLTGLNAKPGKYDKAALNYVTATNELVVSVKVASAAVYGVWKSQPSIDDQAPLPGIGEDAIMSKQGRYICFKKAGTGVCLTGMPSPAKGQPLVPDAKLLELARLAASNVQPSSAQ